MIRSYLAALAAVALLAAPALAEAQPIPVRIRVIKGSRQGPAAVDPRLENQKRQLSALAYVKWDLVEERSLELSQGKVQFLSLPGGDDVGVTLQERRGDTVTIEVALAARNTQSRLTVERGQRIVHQVSPEKNGAAIFLTVMAWP
ncbi:MAG TPA: hypothetical protein VF875_02470 [Anaeromyxobacter sp.]